MTKQRKVIAIVVNLLCALVYLGIATAAIAGENKYGIVFPVLVCCYNAFTIAWVLNTRTEN